MKSKKFKPRKFKALKDEFGLDDGGVASFTFKVQSLFKDKIYEESNPEYLSTKDSGVVIDDNGCWNHVGSKGFYDRFEEIFDNVPRYEYNSHAGLKFLANFVWRNVFYDLYFCPNMPTVIAVFGDDQPGMFVRGLGMKHGALIEAERLAREKGLLNEE